MRARFPFVKVIDIWAVFVSGDFLKSLGNKNFFCLQVPVPNAVVVTFEC